MNSIGNITVGGIDFHGSKHRFVFSEFYQLWRRILTRADSSHLYIQAFLFLPNSRWTDPSVWMMELHKRAELVVF